MRFLRFACESRAAGCWGMLEGETTIRVLEGDFLDCCKGTRETVPLSAVERYLSPVMPPNIIALGLNYHTHAGEVVKNVPSAPLLFIKATTSVTAHRGDIVLPREAPDEVDFEVELAVIIKDRIKDVPEESALEHVFGYTIGQDISARDCQMKHDRQWARAKSFDTFCPLGPWIETELDPAGVMLRTYLNGELMQEQSSSDMVFPVARTISYISRMFTLLPGTVIMTGTPGGVGYSRKPPVFLREGDELVSEIEGIGRMENRVIRGQVT